LATPTQASAQALVPRWLVVAVIVMGLLLVVGTIFVGTEVSRRLSSPRPAATPATAGPPISSPTSSPVSAPAVPDAIFRQKIQLPDGTQVISMMAVADRLIVQVENQDGVTSAYVVDPRSGALLGTIDFPPGVPR
jgi:hypothetical protein